MLTGKEIHEAYQQINPGTQWEELSKEDQERYNSVANVLNEDERKSETSAQLEMIKQHEARINRLESILLKQTVQA